MNDNIWFYTLSSASQVLAALVAFFAVFVVWKIQIIDNILGDVRTACVKIIENISSNTDKFEHVTFSKLYFMSDYEILEKFSELLLIKTKEPGRIKASMSLTNTELVTYSLDEFTKDNYKLNVDKRFNVLKDLRKVLIIGLCTITVCLSALTFSNAVTCKYDSLVIILILVIYNLYLIGDRIYTITT